MADLQQIVGAILRDLAKARFSTDLYSRSIARYYENDYLLRKFPIPRADIEEVEIDLKFSLAEVVPSVADTQGREANAANVMERGVEKIVATFLDLARAYVYGQANEDIANALRTTLSRGFSSTTVRIELRQRALRYLIESYSHLIGPEGDFDAARVRRELRRPFLWGFAEYRHDGIETDAVEEALRPVFDHVFAHDSLAEAVDALAAPIKKIWLEYFDARLDVVVEGHKLAELGDGAVSTIRVKASVRNMIWTEVKIDERRSRYALTSD